MNGRIVVIGSLNTDIFISGFDNFPKSGQMVYAKDFRIGAGGKGRNIAEMTGVLTSKNTVAMIGKSSKDPYGLWEVPIKALKKIGVNTDYVDVDEKGKFPGIGIIPVNNSGENTIYVVHGANQDFSKEDIDKAEGIVSRAEYIIVEFTQPVKTYLYAIKMANKYNSKVLIEPGGISNINDPKEVLNKRLFLLKPNEHEAEILTGIKVNDFTSAQKAARKLLSKNVENLLITNGKNGAYFFNKNNQEHIKIPKIKKTKTMNETGCGDQTMAGLVASLSKGANILEAVKVGILAGTLQFYKPGIIPVATSELNKYLN